MLIFLIVFHVIICLALIFIVLIQTGKGGLDSNFGGIATNALGTQGANEFVKKWTKILFIAFVLSCILLATQVRGGFRAGSERRSRLQNEAQRAAQPTTPSTEDLMFDMNQDFQIDLQTQEMNTESE